MEINRTLFSWSKNQLEYPEKTMEFLEKGKVTTIFQHITQQDSASALRSFVAVAEEAEKQVYFLMGDPAWTFELDPLLQMIQIAETYQPKGIVIDVEPYLLDEFQRNPKEVMDAFVTNMKKAYQATERELILCVPYFYDEMGFSKELEQLVAEASDGIAVMNYYRGKEADHLRTEALLCANYDKPIYTIYELQPPGIHSITPRNTYYQVGLRAAERQFEELRHDFPNQEIHVSFHEYNFYKKLFEREAL